MLIEIQNGYGGQFVADRQTTSLGLQRSRVRLPPTSPLQFMIINLMILHKIYLLSTFFKTHILTHTKVEHLVSVIKMRIILKIKNEYEGSFVADRQTACLVIQRSRVRFPPTSSLYFTIINLNIRYKIYILPTCFTNLYLNSYTD